MSSFFIIDISLGRDQSQMDFKFNVRHMTLQGGWVNICDTKENFNKHQFSNMCHWVLNLVVNHKKEYTVL